MKLFFVFVLLCSVCLAGKPCTDRTDPLARAGFSIPEGKAKRYDFPVNKAAAKLRGTLTEREKKDLIGDKKVWDKLKLADSKVKPKLTDSALYPASGVDFGTPIHLAAGAGLYIGVDIEGTFTNRQIQSWAGDAKFDVAKLFSERSYLSTIPYMITGDAGHDADFAKSHLKNLVSVLPEDAVVESVSFILDYQPFARSFTADKTPKPVGPHILVTWCNDGVRQSSLLLSTPMLSPEEGKGIWWYQQIDKIKPSYGVMKRPQGFSFDDVFGQMCEWTVAKGGYIVSEAGTEDNTKDGKPGECLKNASYKRHEVTAADVGRTGEGREGKIFGFDATAMVLEVFGPKGSARRTSPGVH